MLAHEQGGHDDERPNPEVEDGASVIDGPVPYTPEDIEEQLFH
jgi:hypothetical protein